MSETRLPLGFLATGDTCGIKSTAGALDLSLFVSDRPCAAAGVFTQNLVVGAPVVVSRSRVPSDSVRAVVINSGNANACTGARGVRDAESMASATAAAIDCAATDVLVCSTGIIGHFLPIAKIEAGIASAASGLVATEDAFLAAARGMMTTDTVPKRATRTISTPDGTITVSGACKGAAMIAPNMATMLGVVMTDAALTSRQADEWLRDAANRSFNCISVEGHTSTSDTVLLLANGASGIDVTAHEQSFRLALKAVCSDLAQQIIRDAEGADHFVTIDVQGAASEADAHRIAKTVADSALVKTAITGNDPNWGRIVSAAGYAGVAFDVSQVSLTLNGQSLYEAGAPVEFDEAATSASMKQGEVAIVLTVGEGDGSARFWTCDLTAEYVRLNADYTT